MKISLSFLILIGVMSGCSILDEPDSRVYEGTYIRGWEMDTFSPCGEVEGWWITSGGEKEQLVNRYNRVITALGDAPGSVFVRLRGERSEEGNYGNLGHYDYAFRVDEVLRVRPRESEDCE